MYKIAENRVGQRMFITFESMVRPTLGPVDADANAHSAIRSWMFETQGKNIKNHLPDFIHAQQYTQSFYRSSH